MQLNQVLQDSLLDLARLAPDGGAGAGLFVFYSDTGLTIEVATFTLNDPSFDATFATAGTLRESEMLTTPATPSDPSATGGTAIRYRVTDSTAQELWIGDIGLTGDGTTNDIEMPSNVIGVGEQVDLNQYTLQLGRGTV